MVTHTCLNTRDETIRSSHDTIRIDTKGDSTIIFNMSSYCKNTSFYNIHIFFIYNHLTDKHNRGMLPFVSLTNPLAIRFTKHLDKNKCVCLVPGKKGTVEVMFCISM